MTEAADEADRARTNGRRERADADGETMADVSHTHPLTGETFGGVYRRGPAVTDGSGGAAERRADRMRDVDHTSAADGANEMWRRGPNAGESESEAAAAADGRTDR